MTNKQFNLWSWINIMGWTEKEHQAYGKLWNPAGDDETLERVLVKVFENE